MFDHQGSHDNIGDIGTGLVDPLDPTHGFYQAIFFTDPDLVRNMTTDQMDAVIRYCETFYVRLVYMYRYGWHSPAMIVLYYIHWLEYSYPNTSLGVSPITGVNNSADFGLKYVIVIHMEYH